VILFLHLALCAASEKVLPEGKEAYQGIPPANDGNVSILTEDANATLNLLDTADEYIPDTDTLAPDFNGSTPLYLFESLTDVNTTVYKKTVEEQHDWLEERIYDTSNFIDMFFSGNRENIVTDKKSYVGLSYFIGYETLRAPEYRFNLSSYLALPRTEERWRLTIESYDPDESVDQGASGTAGGAATEQDYLLGLQYLTEYGFLSNVSFGTGIRTSGLAETPDPYVSVTARRSFYYPENWELWLANKLQYFVVDKTDNKTEVRISRVISEETKFEFYNSMRYLQDGNYWQLKNQLSLYKLLPNKRGVAYQAALYSLRDPDEMFKLQYYYLGVFFRQMIHEEWIYVELTPALMWRTENNFQASERISLNFGIVFGEDRRYSYRKFAISSAQE
jgi:hypothetical protein